MNASVATLPHRLAVPAAEKRRLDFIDALRGFACVWVLLHHSFEHVPVSGTWAGLPLDLLICFSRIGWLGVSLFLVLSGFCLYYPLVRKSGVANVRLDLKDFVRRRARRILPPYLAALALFTALAWYGPRTGASETVGWKDVISHALMLHNLRPSTFASINPAFWSLALEVQLYCAFPFLVWLACRRGLRAALIVTLGVAIIVQGIAFARYGLSREWAANMAVAYHSLPARCFEFALGMCAAAFVARTEPRHVRVAAWCAGLLALPALGFVLFISRFGPLCDTTWGIIFASGVVLLSRVPDAHFVVIRPLRVLVWLGTISYSVYLVHQPLLGLFAPEQFGWRMDSRLIVIVFGLARLAVVVGIGFGFYLLLERPFILQRKTGAGLFNWFPRRGAPIAAQPLQPKP